MQGYAGTDYADFVGPCVGKGAEGAPGSKFFLACLLKRNEPYPVAGGLDTPIHQSTAAAKWGFPTNYIYLLIIARSVLAWCPNPPSEQ